MNHNEALESEIISNLKSLGFTRFEKFRSAIYWLKTFSRNYVHICHFVGGLVSVEIDARHCDSADDGIDGLDEERRDNDGILKGHDRRGLQ